MALFSTAGPDIGTLRNADGSYAYGIVGYAYGPSAATFTRPNDTNAYTALDVVADSTSSPSVLEFDGIGATGGHIMLSDVTFLCTGNAVPPTLGVLRLHLYNIAPTAIADNAAYNLPVADRDKYVGYVDIPTPVDLGDTIWSQAKEINKTIKLASGDNKLYGILQTIESCGAAASLGITISLSAIEVGR